MAEGSGNVLYYGDNLDVLRLHVADESVDLVYLDPPFNSNATYSVLFGHVDGTKSAAQIKAFEDTWQWDSAAAAAFQEVVTRGGDVAQALAAFRTLLGPSTMLAYLSMMAPRLLELRRVLKATGSLYLHCDPTASHYLKLLLDAVFGPENFRSEIVWKRSSAHSDTVQGRKIHGHIHDLLLFYTRGKEWTWNPVYTPYDESYIKSKYRYVEPGTNRRYRLSDLTAKKPGGDTSYEWHGRHPYKGRYWAYSKDNMDKFHAEGRIQFPSKPTGVPELKRYLDEQPGVPLQDIWTDLDPINARASERLGYPTQKPEALLERIITASSNPGDVVLDPFCGCGTSVVAAEKLKRRWQGIDLTYLAISLIKSRLTAMGSSDYTVLGEPTTADDAADLAAEDPYQFQWWALGLVGARPAEGKKGADQGIDGRLFFFDGDQTPKQVIVSVKAGGVQASHVRDLRGVLDREQAQIGVLISFNEPTQPMRQEAATAEFYTSMWGNHPRIQLLTVAELLAGKRINMPAGGAHMTQVALPPTPEETVHPDQLSLGG
jgi:adenine specific DNA methylase Mod